MTVKKRSSKDKAKAPRCPNCGKRGALKVVASERTPEGRARERICKLCDHRFNTVMILPYRCPHCDTADNFTVRRTKNLHTGTLRYYQCDDCKRFTPSFEAFPVPDDKRKRPDPNRL